MNKIIIGLLALGSLSAFAQKPTLERTAEVISRYTPLSAEQILSSEQSLNRAIAWNYVAGSFFGNLNNDLKKEFGKCAHQALWDSEEITVIELSEAISVRCNL